MTRNVHSSIVTTVTFYLGLAQTILISVSGISLLQEWNPALPGILMSISVILAAIQASADRFVQERVVPATNVIEYSENDYIFAGPGADLTEPDTYIRPKNSPYDPNDPTHQVR